MSARESISAVVPFAGDENLLLKAINSIYAQTYKVSEVVIVDNSVNGISKEMVGQLVGEKLVILKTSPYIGAARARNLGIEKSSSKYVAFLDADDIWLPNKIEIQFGKMCELELDVSTSDFYFKRPSRLYAVPQSKNGAVEKGIFLRSHNGTGSTLIIKNSAFKFVGYFNPKLFRFEDWDFMMRLKKTNLVWAHFNIPLSLVQRIPNSNWSLARKSLALLREFNPAVTRLERIQFRSGLHFETATIDFRENLLFGFIFHFSISILLWPPQLIYILNQNLKKLRGRVSHHKLD
jgi:teichuronic acid biosynthesis glycosyltransferase TuaG